jgi:hypothetical protein
MTPNGLNYKLIFFGGNFGIEMFLLCHALKDIGNALFQNFNFFYRSMIRFTNQIMQSNINFSYFLDLKVLLKNLQ